MVAWSLVPAARSACSRRPQRRRPAVWWLRRRAPRVPRPARSWARRPARPSPAPGSPHRPAPHRSTAPRKAGRDEDSGNRRLSRMSDRPPA
jgi:hypothetical protein